jgi:site-specific recombinase
LSQKVLNLLTYFIKKLALYDDLLEKEVLSRKSSWSEEKDDILDRVKGPEFRLNCMYE